MGCLTPHLEEEDVEEEKGGGKIGERKGVREGKIMREEKER